MCKSLNYFEHFIDFVYAVSGCVSISAFASLVGILISITSSPAGLKISAITQELKSINQLSKKEKSMIIKYCQQKIN